MEAVPQPDRETTAWASRSIRDVVSPPPRPDGETASASQQANQRSPQPEPEAPRTPYPAPHSAAQPAPVPARFREPELTVVPEPGPQALSPASEEPRIGRTQEPAPLNDDIPLFGPQSRSTSRRETTSRVDTQPVTAGTPLDEPASRREPLDLRPQYQGVIRAAETWAREGTVIVNTGRLYRLVNQVAAARAEADLLFERVDSAVGDATGEMRDIARGLAGAAAALESDVVELASLPLSTLTGTLPQLVNYLSKKLGKNVEMEIKGGEGVVVDRQILQTISEPIRQLVVNAIYHGLEFPARRKDQRKPVMEALTLDINVEGNMLELVMADDGAGVDWDLVHSLAVDNGLIESGAPRGPEELTPILFEPGFTTGAIEGGLGDGLARLATAVEGLHGRVHFETWPDDGTRVTVRIPSWQALQRVLIVRSGGMRWAIPEAAVERVMSNAEAGIASITAQQTLEHGGKRIPLLSFATAAGAEPSGTESSILVLNHGVGAAALGVESIEGRFDVAVTDIADLAAGPGHVTGVALLGTNEIALVVDAGLLIEQTHDAPGGYRQRSTVLVVDDSEGSRAALAGSLAASGFNTSVTGSTSEALRSIAEIQPDALVVDFSLPSASSMALVEEVRRRDPELPIVIISGIATEDDRIWADQVGVSKFFDKANFQDGALVSALLTLLEA